MTFGYAKTRCCLPLALICLAACGSTADLDQNDDFSDDPSAPITGRQELPATGVATYAGFLTLDLPLGADRVDASGDLAITIDFGAVTEQVTGVADNFTAVSVGTLSGRVYLTAGILAEATSVDPAGFVAGLSGTLVGGTFPNTLLTGSATGSFVGAEINAISGIVFGDATTGTTLDIFDGSFSVAQN